MHVRGFGSGLFFCAQEGLRKTVLENGNKVVFNDTYILYLARKPL